MATFSLFIAEFADNETDLIDALFTIGDRYLADTWRYQSLADADAILLAYDSNEGLAMLSPYQRENPGAIIILCGENLPHFEWCLERELGAPPKIYEFTAIFNRIGEKLSAKSRSEDIEPGVFADDNPVLKATLPRTLAMGENGCINLAGDKGKTGSINVKTDSSSRFIPEDYFLGLLQQARNNNMCCSFMWGEKAALYVIPGQDCYYSLLALNELAPLFGLPARQVTVTALDIKDAQHTVKVAELTEKPVTDLVWYAAISASQGRLLDKCSDSDIVNLTYWPDISHLPRYQEFLPLAAFMNSNAADLSTIAQSTGTEMATVYDFHNTCEALGILDRNHHQPSIRARETNSGLRIVCQRISDKLDAHKRQYSKNSGNKEN